MTDQSISAIGGTDDLDATGDGSIISLIKRLRTLLATGLDTDLFGGLAVIKWPHHQIHAGDMYQASFKSPDGSDVADDADIVLSLLTPDDKLNNVTFEFNFGGDAEIKVYRGAAGVSGTAIIPTFNMNEWAGLVEGKNSNAQVQLITSVTTTGTLIHESFLPGGMGGLTLGGTARADTEWIYNTGTAYLIRGINRAGTAQPGSLVLQYYEENIP